MPETQLQAQRAAPRFEGRPLTLAGTEYIVPPLTIGAIRRLTPIIDRIGAADTRPVAEQIDDVVVIVHAALVRNYPELTPDEVADLIEIPAVGDVVQAVLEASGLVKRPAGSGTGANGNAEGNGSAGQR